MLLVIARWDQCKMPHASIGCSIDAVWRWADHGAVPECLSPSVGCESQTIATDALCCLLPYLSFYFFHVIKGVIQSNFHSHFAFGLLSTGFKLIEKVQDP